MRANSAVRELRELAKHHTGGHDRCASCLATIAYVWECEKVWSRYRYSPLRAPHVCQKTTPSSKGFAGHEPFPRVLPRCSAQVPLASAQWTSAETARAVRSWTRAPITSGSRGEPAPTSPRRSPTWVLAARILITLVSPITGARQPVSSQAVHLQRHQARADDRGAKQAHQFWRGRTTFRRVPLPPLISFFFSISSSCFGSADTRSPHVPSAARKSKIGCKSSSDG